MLQYVSGGKWGLLLRRPLEAMTRTLPLVGADVPADHRVFMKHLYLWAQYPDAEATANALANHSITLEQALTANAKRPMLNPVAVIVQSCDHLRGSAGCLHYLLNKWSLQRDADPAARNRAELHRWQTKFENLSGFGILIYVDHADAMARSTGSSRST